MENRCLLSSGFEAGVLSANLLRSPLRDTDPSRHIAIRRFVPVALLSPADSSHIERERIRVTYTAETLQLPWENPGRQSIRDIRPDRITDSHSAEKRPGDAGALRAGGSNGISEYRHARAPDEQRPADEKTERAPVPSERERMGTVAEDEQAWQRLAKLGSPHTRFQVPGWSAWSLQRFQNRRHLEVGDSETIPNETNERPADAEQTETAGDEARITAYHAVVGSENAWADLAMNLEALAAVMNAENSDDRAPTASPIDATFMEAGAFFEAMAVDLAFASMAHDGQDSVVAMPPTPSVPAPCYSAHDVSANDKAASMAAAAAVLVAGRVESRRGPSRAPKKSGWPGWIGAAAQFMLMPRFTTPKQPTVMLALNDDVVRDELHQALIAEGFNVREAGTLREAVCHVQASWEVIDVAVVDTDLDYPGIYLCNKIREKYPNLPVVVCSEDATHPDLSQFRRLGARRCLMKPITPSELLATINALVS